MKSMGMAVRKWYGPRMMLLLASLSALAVLFVGHGAAMNTSAHEGRMGHASMAHSGKSAVCDALCTMVSEGSSTTVQTPVEDKEPLPPAPYLAVAQAFGVIMVMVPVILHITHKVPLYKQHAFYRI